MSRGVSPESTSTSVAASAGRDSRALRTASPVPSGCSCTAISSSPNWLAAPGETTTTSRLGESGRTASSTQSTMRRPRIEWRCLGVAELIRVPWPAAMTTAASELSVTFSETGIAGMAMLEWLGRQDSNLGSRDQNPLPYHLATPH